MHESVTSDFSPDQVSVVIPVLNAARYLPALLEAIFSQEPVAPGEVILVDSCSTDDTVSIARQYDRVKVVPIEDFSHGRSRNLGVQNASGQIAVLMTQDAIPRDNRWLYTLLAPFEDPDVAAVYSRQVPYPDASPMEQYFLKTHFPSGRAEKRQRDGRRHLAFRDVFFSNVSAALRRDVLLEHPFDESLIMSEDQQVSRDIMMAGHAIVYQPASVVTHSHNYSLATVFRRYFDSVYSLTVIFPRHDMGTSASMGFRYLWQEFLFILTKKPLWIPYYACYTVAKTGGTVAGHFAEKLPKRLVKKLSMHHYHWQDSDP